MKVVVDQSACLASGACVLASPDVFDLPDSDVVRVIQPNPPDSLRAAVEEAVAGCPASCISIIDA